MTKVMPDSRLNDPERHLQRSFRKWMYFNGLLLGAGILAAFVPIRALPDRTDRPPVVVPVAYVPVHITATPPLRVAGAWQMIVPDRRAGGLSGLAVDQGRFLAVSDLGAAVRFDSPAAARPVANIVDLRSGPGKRGRKSARDAEALVRDPRGRGWWVAYEQHHSLWLYDSGFARAAAAIRIHRPQWWNNRGVEGLVADASGLVALPENGREAIRVNSNGIHSVRLKSGMDVADAARAPDGTIWLLLRTKGLAGISQAIAPLIRSGSGYRAGHAWPLPKAALDNYEGMTIAPLPEGGWRLWLVTDDGHRFMARTLLVALDWKKPPEGRYDKRPAAGARRL